MRIPYEGVCACCDRCGGEIYEGEGYYCINGEVVCEDCLADYARSLLAPYYEGGV